MSTASHIDTPLLLVGSVPLADARAVLTDSARCARPCPPMRIPAASLLRQHEQPSLEGTRRHRQSGGGDGGQRLGMMKDPKGAVGDFITGSPSFKGREAFIKDVFRAYNEYTYGNTDQVPMAQRIGPRFPLEWGIYKGVMPPCSVLPYQGPGSPGVIDAGRLAAVQKFYVSQGIVPKDAPVGEIFTHQFVR